MATFDGIDLEFDDAQDGCPWALPQQWPPTNFQSLLYDGDGLTQHQVSNDWSNIEPSDPQASHSNHRLVESSDDLERIYTELHKSVDLVVSQISAHVPLRLDQIRQRNRELIEKLTSLDNSIATDPTDIHPNTIGSTQSTVPDALQATSPVRGDENLGGTSSGPKNTRSKNRDKPDADGSVLSIPDGLQRNPSLARKLMQIGNAETRIQIADFAAQLEATQHQAMLPKDPSSNVSHVSDMPQFLLLVQNLGQAILNSSFGERHSRIRNRIALAHFYHAYTTAQSYPEKFLAWCNDQPMLAGSVPPKGRIQSVVQQRFADLILLGTQHPGSMRLSRPSDTADDGRQRITRIQMWRKNGKKWAHIIQRFGYGILLLVPPSLADEDLRLAHDEVFASALDFIDSRKHLFADVLQQANDLLTTHFFVRGNGAQLSLGYGAETFEVARMNGFFNVP